MTTKTFRTFDTWAMLLDHISAGYPLYYHAPLDARPVIVNAVFRNNDGRLRITPPYTDADPFTADVDHLPRFRRLARPRVWRSGRAVETE